jgi:beta-phosphoglucomutase-like phosphatase (HAD superfamily)
MRPTSSDPVPSPGRPDAVVFDCDGVLVDSEPITNGVLCEMLVELGLDFDLDRTIRTFMGKSVKDEIGVIETMIGRPLVADWHPQFVRRRDAALALKIREVPGVRAVVERLAAMGVPFAVASGADCAKMRLTLGTCGLLHFFKQHMFGADMVAGPNRPRTSTTLQ